MLFCADPVISILLPRRRVPDCRDDAAELPLKEVAMLGILLAGVLGQLDLGVGLLLAGRKRRALRMDSAPFLAAKVFAAGIILPTGFVHMLYDEHARCSPLPVTSWQRFPFSRFVAIAALLATSVLDFLATRFCRSKHSDEATRVKASKLAASSARDEDIAMWSPSPSLFLQTRYHGYGHSHICQRFWRWGSCLTL